MGLYSLKNEVDNPKHEVVQLKKCGYPTPNLGFAMSKMGFAKQKPAVKQVF
jgi:hypothetical protein